MRTKSISIERNFHISNDDRYLMERIVQVIELDENDLGFEQAAMDAARQSIVDNFKHAYPDVSPDLNFDKQSVDRWNYTVENKTHITTVKEQFCNGSPTGNVSIDIQRKTSADDVLKASLKEMMECKTVEELESSWKIWAKGNGAEKTYDALYKELSK